VNETFPAFLAKFIINDFRGIANGQKITVADSGIDPQFLRDVAWLAWKGIINRAEARLMIESQLPGKEVEA
jgi:Asp-tRNA(Asn)/Glu-tRNA(Gln) amidotransferase B subunit